MPEWTPTPGETVIVHLSDLHFGTHNQTRCWDTLAAYLRDVIKPELVLVTGDIVDTPDRDLYAEAKKAFDNLQVPYFVCPGNHDRHFKGNVSRFFSWVTFRGDTSSEFDRVFAEHLVTPGRVLKQKIGTRWEIGLLGVDSSRESRFFARGYVHPDLFQSVEKTARADTDPDLVILLTHHHLQSIRKLETERRERIRDLANLTQMVNSGSFLESLTRARIDLVLHGHEHAWHWAKYGSLEKGKGDVCVIGAGSGTGNSSTRGCSLERASFNTINIAPNRSVTLRIIDTEGGAWRIREEIPLFNATDARKFRLLRRAGNLNADLNGHVTKHVELTRERDVLVRWVYRNWRLDNKRFEYAVYNSTGRPVNAVLKVERPGRESSEFVFKKFAPHPNKDHTWYVACDLDESYVKELVNIEFSFVWLGGALLLEQEMSAIKSPAAGLLRREDHEFAYVHSSGPVAFVNLQVTVPPEYAPNEVEVRVYDQDEKRYEDEERELKERILVLGTGRYSLTVTYPRENWWYVLTWRPVQQPVPSQTETRFKSIARAQGNSLLEQFRKSMPSTIKDSTRLTLYLTTSGGTAERAGHLDVEGASAPHSVPIPNVVRGDLSLMGQAFWGVPASTSRLEAQDAAEELGFASDEAHLLLLPVRFGLGWTNPSPWAVVRLGITSPEAAAKLPPPESLHLMLAPSITGLLTAALEQG